MDTSDFCLRYFCPSPPPLSSMYLPLIPEEKGSTNHCCTKGARYSACTVSMIDLGLFFLEKSLSEVLGRIKFNKKDLEIYIFYLRKLSQLGGQFCSTALVIDTFYVKYCSVLTRCTNAVLQN